MKKTFHFVGIGGIGMGTLATLVLSKGYRVSGSDVKESAMTIQLKDKGAKISIGHHKNNIEGADYIVFSSAISVDNPELAAAREKKLPVLKRAELLARLME